jgi:superfamily II DNA or RNA helicase
MLVADECHGYGGNVLRKSLLKGYEDRLGLTATLERSDDAVDTVILPYFGGVCFRYGFAEAIADGVCAEPRVAFVAVPLTEHERREYDATESRIVAARRLLKQIPGVPREPFGDFLAAVQHLATNDGGPDGRAANDYLQSLSSRREIVATSSAKYEALGRFGPSISSSDGTLLFTETVRAANHAIVRLDPAVAIEIITGDTPRKERTAILEGLRSGRLDAVAAPRVLDEGVDVPDANLGIVVSASRTRRQMIQRMGRVLRRKQLGRGARFVIIFSADTMEDPRAAEDRDGFLEEIEEISESTRIFGPGHTDRIAAFLEYDGPPTLVEPTTVDPAVVRAECERDRSHIEPAPYLETIVAIEPEIRTPRVTKPKPRLSTGQSPVVAEQVDEQWVLRCTGCGAASTPSPYRWQALEQTVDCVCE